MGSPLMLVGLALLIAIGYSVAQLALLSGSRVGSFSTCTSTWAFGETWYPPTKNAAPTMAPLCVVPLFGPVMQAWLKDRQKDRLTATAILCEFIRWPPGPAHVNDTKHGYEIVFRGIAGCISDPEGSREEIEQLPPQKSSRVRL